MALDSAGAGDQIDHGDPSGWDGASALTIMLWINYDVIATTDFLRKTDGSNRSPEMRDVSGSNWRVYHGDTSPNDQYAEVASVFVAGTWTHIAWVFDGSQAGTARVAMYVDGVAQTPTYSGTPPATIASVTGNVLVAEANCKVAHLKVWTGALSASDVAQEVYSYQPMRTANLIIWCPYDDGTTAADYSGSGNDGTVTGATQTAGPPVGVRAPVIVV